MEWSEFEDCKKPADLLRQLLALGYDVTQRTLYRHCKSGRCGKNESGHFSRRMVTAYVEAEGLTRNGEIVSDSGPDVSLAIEKQRLENEKLEIHNSHARLKMQKDAGGLIEREGVFLEIAARLVALDNTFRQKIETNLPAIITLVKGDMGRQPELTQYVFTLWDELLNSFATLDEFEVLFDDDDHAVDGPDQDDD